ncbi:hypothetical protein TNIN_150241 [Trichonephila inaurata madagascariensis]|uniref:Uncharacterized protein n=1 Tax=Trichonephila inaurata madagascariensis TaxID=2747483 RepID=A0A8X6XCD8_9ARAC|nr:hypothetical protein TNIN_150241 [Trichonephila inaurata madagascariensis]
MPDATLITRHLGIPPRINQHDENSLWDPTNQLQKNRKSFGQRDKKMEETTTMKQPSCCTIFVHYSESIHKKRFSGGETGTGRLVAREGRGPTCAPRAPTERKSERNHPAILPMTPFRNS